MKETLMDTAVVEDILGFPYGIVECVTCWDFLADRNTYVLRVHDAEEDCTATGYTKTVSDPITACFLWWLTTGRQLEQVER